MTLLGRVGGALFGLTSMIVLAQALLVDEQATDRSMLLVLSALAALVGVAAMLLPARRWNQWTMFALPLVGLVLLTVPAGGDLSTRLLILYLPLFVFVGLTQRRMWVVAMVPATVASFVVGFGVAGSLSVVTVTDFFLLLTVAVSLGLALSAALDEQRRASAELAHLVNGARALDRVTRLDEAVSVFERAIVDLVGADAATTFVRDDGLGDRFVRVAKGGSGVPDDAADVDVTVSSAAAERLGPLFSARRAEFVAELARWPVLADEGPALLPSARSALFIPLRGASGNVGFTLVGWNRSISGLSELAEQAVDLLVVDAGEAIDRFRQQRAMAVAPFTDPLTGLLSRRSVDQRLRLIEPGDVVMVIDLDRFRDFNDDHGSTAGDRALRTLAACLMDSCRREDWCGRLSAEEFIVVFRGAGEAVPVAIARVRERWARLEPDMTFSAGVAVHEVGGVAAETLAHAGGALDLAKDLGRNRVEYFPGEAEYGAI